MSGKAAKTNFGTEVLKQRAQVELGNPSLASIVETSATVIDIRLPDAYRKRNGYGIMVKLKFDDSRYVLKAWVSLKNDFHEVRLLLGNRDAILKNPPRVLYRFNPTRIEEGYAELMCDNKQEEDFNLYERNRSNMFLNSLSGLAFQSKIVG